jgi:hypothetical protein
LSTRHHVNLRPFAIEGHARRSLTIGPGVCRAARFAIDRRRKGERAVTSCWSEADNAALKRMLAEGRSLNEMASALTKTKYAVAGRARRMRAAAARQGLPARRPEGWMLSPIHRVASILPAAAAPSLRPPPVTRAWLTCQFPLWPDGGDISHPDYGAMCGKPSLQGRSYCAEHHASCARPAPAEPPLHVQDLDASNGSDAPLAGQDGHALADPHDGLWLGGVPLGQGDLVNEGATMETDYIPGSGRFTVVLKASEADWVRASAVQRSTSPDELIRSLIAQARANDASKGGRLSASLDLAERRRLAAGIGG